MRRLLPLCLWLYIFKNSYHLTLFLNEYMLTGWFLFWKISNSSDETVTRELMNVHMCVCVQCECYSVHMLCGKICKLLDGKTHRSIEILKVIGSDIARRPRCH